MTFDRPEALWLLLALPFFLFLISFPGWKMKKEAAAIFPSILQPLKKKHVEKYIMAGIIMILLTICLAAPKIPLYSAPVIQKTGEVMLLVDVSGSMAAKPNIDSLSRLERAKIILYDIIDNLEKLGQVKISLYGFTDIPRSIVPFVSTEDYQYLKESIEKVLDVYATPGSGSSLGKSIQNSIPRFSEGIQNKIIVLISDGEPYMNGTRGMTYHERVFIKDAIEQAVKENITIITIGVGEKEGARIPLYDSEGKFTGEYAQKEYGDISYESGVDLISYLEEEGLMELSSQTGGEYFFEKNIDGLTELITQNLGSVNENEFTQEIKDYKSITNWFLLASLPVWILFTKRHIF
jgi:Ca-activated chloride channel homolog